MLHCRVVAPLLFVSILNVQPNDASNVIKPLIEVLSPRGFRMTIEDSHTIRSVRFRASVNKELSYSPNAHYKVVRQAVHGRWIWEEPDLCLKTGDKIYYSIYVHADRIGYQNYGNFLVTGVPSSSSDASDIQPTQATPCYTCNSHNNHAKPPAQSTTSPPESTIDFQIPMYEQLFVNCSLNLLSHQTEMEALRRTNQQLHDFIEKYPDAKRLTLSGRIPTDGEATMTAVFIIRERLELNPNIVSAVRKSDDSIEFEVATLAEKLEILEVAKEKLISSRITIF